MIFDIKIYFKFYNIKLINMTSGKTKLSTCVVLASTVEVNEATIKNLNSSDNALSIFTIPVKLKKTWVLSYIVTYLKLVTW